MATGTGVVSTGGVVVLGAADMFGGADAVADMTGGIEAIAEGTTGIDAAAVGVIEGVGGAVLAAIVGVGVGVTAVLLGVPTALDAAGIAEPMGPVSGASSLQLTSMTAIATEDVKVTNFIELLRAP
jgi:hypothetical protein